MNMLAKTVATLAFGTLSLTSVTSFAAPATEQQATANLISQLNSIQSITANFEQTTTASGKKNTLNKGLSAQHMNRTFKGVMKVERPGKFYWQTSSPSKQTIITSGKTVWIHDPDLQQVVKQNLDDQVANTPALLLSGNAQQIMQAYRVTQPDKSKTYYTLFPKDQEGAFQSLTLSFGAKSAPTLMILKDSLGQTTHVRFSGTQLNAKIPAGTFNFVVPKGTDVIEQ